MQKSDREIMEILEAFDLTRCPHSAADLAGCDLKDRDPLRGRPGPGRRPRLPAAPADAGRPVPGQDRGARRTLGRPGPRRRRPRAPGASRPGRERAHDAPGGPAGEGGVPRRAPADVPALGDRARHVAPVRLGQGTRDRWPSDAALLRLARLEPLPGRHPDLRPHDGLAPGLPRCHPASDRRCPHVRPHRQRADGHDRADRGRRRPPPL